MNGTVYDQLTKGYNWLELGEDHLYEVTIGFQIYLGIRYGCLNNRYDSWFPVSYTHLTLPPILRG